ncbi:MAG: polysaccharide biosynthesis tyrosine autokinase [Oscillospiraceae bacterium]|nr:polysaccharide biosynthesis tyrosine autokinase [Oscillospiraceae bacterium]
MDEKSSVHYNKSSGIHSLLMLREVSRRLWAIILAAIICASCTFVAVSVLYEPVYKTRTTFVVSMREGSGTVYSNLSAAKSMADTFSQILSSESMRRKVAEELGTGSFDGRITATVIEETNLLEMTVTAGSAREAFLITKAVLYNYGELTGVIMNGISMDILQRPKVPTAPVNYSAAARYAKLAAAGGAAVGIALCCLSVFLRDTVKISSEVEEKLDTKLLATVVHERKKKTVKELFDRGKRTVLISNPTTGLAFAESFRKLRTRVDYYLRRDNIKTIIVSSVGENEGKSTVAVNLAIALGEKRKSVLLIDADMKKPAVHKIMGYKDEDYKSITELIDNKASLAQTLITDKQRRIGLILGKKGISKSTEYTSSTNMKKLLAQAAQNVDVVIIDTPPLNASSDAEILCELADAAILVVRQDELPTAMINDAIDNINNTGAKLLGCVFNNVRAADLGEAYRYAPGSGYGKYGYGKYGYGSRRKESKAEEEGK